MTKLSVTYASAPSADLLIPTLEFKNEAAGVIRLAQSFNDVTATTSLPVGVYLPRSTQNGIIQIKSIRFT